MLESEADTSLNLKSFAFCFFNEFFTLYWIALGLDGNDDPSSRLFIQLISLVLTSIGTNIALQQVLPWVMLRWATRSSTCCFCCRCKRASMLTNLAYFVREPELAAGEEAEALAEIRNARLAHSSRGSAAGNLAHTRHSTLSAPGGVASPSHRHGRRVRFDDDEDDEDMVSLYELDRRSPSARALRAAPASPSVSGRSSGGRAPGGAVPSSSSHDALVVTAAPAAPHTVMMSGVLTWEEYYRRVGQRAREQRRRERVRGTVASFTASALDEMAVPVISASVESAAALAAADAAAIIDKHHPSRYGYGSGFVVDVPVSDGEEEEEEIEGDDGLAPLGGSVAAAAANNDIFKSAASLYSRGGCNMVTQLRAPASVHVQASKPLQERLVSSAMLEALRPPASKLFNEYLTIMILLGYVMGFSSIFPEGPLAVVIAVWLERQGDLWRFLTVTQRSMPIAASDIGAWQIVLSFLSYSSIISNGIIIFYTSDQGREIAHYDRDFLFVCYLLIVWTVKSFISRFVGDAAAWVVWREERTELRNQENERRFGHVSKEQAMMHVAQLREQVTALQAKVRELGGQ
jgi:hypothetical protein